LEQLRAKHDGIPQTLEARIEATGFDKETQLRKESDYLIKKCAIYEKSTKRPHGPAEYGFNKSFGTIAKVYFCSEHTGYELKASDGITVLEKQADIAAAVKQAYGDDLQLRNEVGMIMDRWSQFAAFYSHCRCQ
jgi:hypothetical protein